MITHKSSSLPQSRQFHLVGVLVTAGIVAIPSLNAIADTGPPATFRTPPGATRSHVFKVKVFGNPVFVQKYKDIHYGHFPISGATSIEIQIDQLVENVAVSPEYLDLDWHSDGKSVRFTLSRPRKLVVYINELDRLFLFADAPADSAPPCQPTDMVNVLTFGADNTGGKLSTEAIVRAIEATPKNGVLYFPPGVYRSATIALKSHMTVYVSDGALIQGSTEVLDYPDREVDVHRTLGPPNVRLIMLDGVEDVLITGFGTLDGQGRKLRAKKCSGQVIVVKNSRNVVVENLFLRDPASYNTRLLFSERVTFRNTKVINDQEVPNTDGIDPEGSRHVLIEDNFAYCSDDNVAVKIYHYDVTQDVYDVTVRGNVFLTRKSALKIGTETKHKAIRDVAFIDNDIVECDRAIVIYLYDDADVRDIRFIDNRVERNYPDRRQRVIDIEMRQRLGAGRLSNVKIRNTFVSSAFPQPSTIRDLDADHPVRDICIENYQVAGRTAGTLEEAQIKVLEHVQGCSFCSSSDGLSCQQP